MIIIRKLSDKKGLIIMKNFSWQYFSLSGKVESYLLYKDLEIFNTESAGKEDGFGPESDI